MLRRVSQRVLSDTYLAMNKYIVITNGGEAFDESYDEVCECIYLGAFIAPDKGAAIELAKKEVDDLGYDFSTYNMIAKQLHDDEKV